MHYVVASEGIRSVESQSLGNRGRDKRSKQPSGTGHLLERPDSESALCGVSAGPLHVDESIPVSGNYMGRYGCPKCKRIASYDE